MRTLLTALLLCAACGGDDDAPVYGSCEEATSTMERALDFCSLETDLGGYPLSYPGTWELELRDVYWRACFLNGTDCTSVDDCHQEAIDIFVNEGCRDAPQNFDDSIAFTDALDDVCAGFLDACANVQ